MILAYRKLTISAKLSIAALIMLVPMGILSYFMEISFRYDIDIGRTELAGTKYLRDVFTIQHWLSDQRTHQLLELLDAEKKNNLELDATTPSVAINHALNRLQKAVSTDSGDLSNGPQHATSALKCVNISRMREAWKWYESSGRSSAFDEASAAVLDLFTQISNCANLALDPALDSHMLGQAFSLLPESSIHMSQLQCLALEMMHATPPNTIAKLSPEQKENMLANATFFKDGLLKKIIIKSRIALIADANYYTYSPTLSLHYGNELNKYQASAESLLEVVNLIKTGQAPPSELFNAAARVRSTGQNLFSTAMTEMNILVQKRIDGYQKWRTIGTGLSAIGVLLAFLMLAATSRSISKSINAVGSYTRAVSMGNYDAKVGRGSLDPSMQKMVEDTASMVGDLKHRIGYLNGILEGMSVPCMVVDRKEKITFINQPYLDLYERDKDPTSYLNMDLAKFFYGKQETETITGRCMRLRAPINNQLIETKTPKGNTRHVRFDVSPLFDLDKQLIGAFAMVMDMTDIKEKEQAIERLAAFPREAPDPVLSAGEDGTVLYMNTAASAVFETSSVSPFHKFLPEGHQEIVTSCLASGTSRYAIKSKIGKKSFLWTYHPLPLQKIVHMYAADITKRIRAEEQLLHDAFHDKLTGLPNKALFLDRVNQALRRARSRGNIFTVLFLDLDGFKTINDGLGHAIGDKLLIRLAWRIKKLIGPDETLARMGGDEFTLLLPNIKKKEFGIKMATRIHQALTIPFDIDNNELFISASIGIINAPDGANDAGDLLRDAETTMYQAKAMGRSRYQVFNPAMHTDASGRLQMENDLKKGVERGEFEPYYQPIVSLKSGLLIGFEALIRWNHPTQGLVSPARFIPLAEETGLIVPMGAFMLEAACTQTVSWQKMFPAYQDLTISVNMSVEQMTRENIGGEVRSILEHTGIPLSTVKIEITESGIMDNVGSALALLTDLETMGVSLMIDDFGTGYSSLSHLHQFPFHYLKIDQSFISTMEDKADNMEIVRTIISLAHTLGKQVVAEGVETTSQKDLLKKLGCEFVQGYYFSTPMPASEAQILLTKNPQW